MLAERVGADVMEIARGIGLDKRIGPKFLASGLGWGGSCFGKDTAAIVATGQEYGVRLSIVEAARNVNCRQRERIVEKLTEILKIVKGRQIGVLGLAFKPDTDDLRDAPALDIAHRLLIRGAKVVAHDPVALERAYQEVGHTGIRLVADAESVFDGSDAVVLATEWEQYQKLDYGSLINRMRIPVLVDGRNCLDRDQLKRIGYQYAALGR
jgi:UDPglucose 6-dehydrogenase